MPFRGVLHERRPRPRAMSDERDLPSPGAPLSDAGAVLASRGVHAPGGAARAAPAAAPRILVAERRGVPEARIELRSGPLAGASIHLVTDASGIQVRLAAPTAAAQRALAETIDRARLHLRTRGIVVRAERVVQTGATGARGRPERGRGP